MRRSSFWRVLLLCILYVNLGSLQAQNVQYLPSHSAVDTAVVDGAATIYFESNVGDLTIISTDDNSKEPIMRIGPYLWCHRIYASKDWDRDDVCFRNYIIFSFC